MSLGSAVALAPGSGDGRARVGSLDVLRGLALAGMIVVNSRGDFARVFPPLAHAPWDGLTAADLVFPTFALAMGVSIPIALGAARAGGAPARALVLRVARRSAILFALGLCLNAYPNFLDLSHLRIPGVLQRLALAYLGAALCALALPRPLAQAAVACALAGGYEALQSFVPVPGFGAGLRTPDGNLGAWLDRRLLGGHLFTAEFDPEGLLGTLPAISTVLIGVVVGAYLRAEVDAPRRAAVFVAGGLLGMLAGAELDSWISVNKYLWSASFVLASGGVALALLGALHLVIDHFELRRWALPLRALGLNPIALYVLSSLAQSTLDALQLAGAAGETQSAKALLSSWLGARVAPMEVASLVYALGTLAIWIGVAAFLERRRIFIRI